MPARFLLFDADYTLLDFPQDMARAFQAMYDACFAAQKPCDETLLACYHACNDRAWARFERGECTKQELYISRFVEFLSKTGLTGDPAAVNECYFTALAQTGTPYPGAQELLATLAPSHELYMITNGNVVSQMPRLKNAGLAGFFREVFVSEAVGAGKPDKRYFDYVAAHIPGFTPEKAVVIGDSPASDIQGAMNAGLKSIWYDPPGAWTNSRPAPAYTWRAENYGDILELLRHV
ncbi:YjjG family noncanonical pyrimidine nucleotidase [Acutalibacter caecimuris]|uniref:YjjG family noncanonical pyrimidine nucleotidase n=1 Tax=Acutalibacter caecimuris TaxID=3093657 RepID=UPI002AC9D1DA|nr:YjjG family noncanonical pyrimidine nucleotidase [Acutalibacter sp. M00118]